MSKNVRDTLGECPRLGLSDAVDWVCRIYLLKSDRLACKRSIWRQIHGFSWPREPVLSCHLLFKMSQQYTFSSGNRGHLPNNRESMSTGGMSMSPAGAL